MNNKNNFDHLGIQQGNTLRVKLSSFSDKKKSDTFYLKILKGLLNSIFYIPRKIIRIQRTKKIKSIYQKHEKDIAHILSSVADDISRETIQSQIDFIKNYDYSGHYTYLEKKGLLQKHNELLDKNEYFPDGIITLTEQEKFVDGGGFNGDTIREFVTRSNKVFNHIFSFEPDKNNFMDLMKEVQTLNLSSDKITCYQKGLYSEHKKLSFFEKGIGSSISEHGTESIEVVGLDDFLSADQKEGITYIKLDVEGAELEALKGMRDIILKNKPKLAICVYHKINDFWEIPYFIESLNLGYKIYFRQHCLGRTDTICYAI